MSNKKDRYTYVTCAGQRIRRMSLDPGSMASVLPNARAKYRHGFCALYLARAWLRAGLRMDSEAATENEWSENESESSDVREAQVHVAAQFSDRQGAQHGRIRDADGSRAERLDGAEGAEERVVDLAGVVHGGGRIIAAPPFDKGQKYLTCFSQAWRARRALTARNFDPTRSS